MLLRFYWGFHIGSLMMLWKLRIYRFRMRLN
ncbi:hypothetical protein MTR67_028319 [Solanum verrucosum]|uniref:Uncharacterized protein n=1 Tax=Solanum verrucosum TaxID=315347 RepID=A0AAF0R2A9_SOLVR|nr:hypothetical protein MTR67_028319 [Solanum verrucosum]